MAFDFSPFRAVLLDLDGTIYHDDQPVPGALELISRLSQENRTWACLTNSGSSPQRVVKRLTSMGIALDASHVFTAAQASCDYLLQTIKNPCVFNLATHGVQEMLDGKVKWVEHHDERCDVVIAGTPTAGFATEERRRTALALLREGAALIGTCADRVYPSPRGIEFGAGAMCAMLSYASGVQPVFCGKPQRIFFDELCQRIAVSPGDCILIGDNLESDVAGARAVGMKTILTLTGVTSREHITVAGAERMPDHVVSSLLELVE
jgi:4-nitrophenyl phosphatase